MNNNEQAVIDLEGIGPEIEKPGLWDLSPLYGFIGLESFLLICILTGVPENNLWWLIAAEAMATISVLFVVLYFESDLSLVKAEPRSPQSRDTQPRRLLSTVACLASIVSFIVVGNIGWEAPIFTPIWVSAVGGVGLMFGLYYMLSAQFALTKKNMRRILLISALFGIGGADSFFQSYRAASVNYSFCQDCDAPPSRYCP